MVDSDAIGVVLNDPPETVTNASHGVGFDLNVVASVEEEESVGGTEIDHVHPVLEGAEQSAHPVSEERNMTQDSDPFDLLPLIEAAATARGGRKHSLATRVEEETVAAEVVDRAEKRVCSIVPCLFADDSVCFFG